MARGRMLNKSVSASLKFQQLPDDTCRLMATWIIAYLDKNGVFYGEPMMVRSFVFPRRDDVTLEQVELYLDEMVKIELIEIFEAEGQTWQHWPGFQDNQIGLRADRESTEYPLPPNSGSDGGDNPDLPDNIPPDDTLYEPEPCQQSDGNLPESIRPNRSLKEHEENINTLSPPASISDEKIPKSEYELIQDAVLEVCKIARTTNNRGTLYSIAREMQQQGRKPSDIQGFGKWWMEYDYRGQKGSYPAVSQITEFWPRYEDFLKNGPPQRNGATNGRNQQPNQQETEAAKERGQQLTKALTQRKRGPP